MSKVKRFVAARLSPEGELGLHLTVGIVLLLLAAWVFTGIAEEMVDAEELTVIDLHVAHWFNANAIPALTRVLLVLTHMHGGIGMTIMFCLLALYFHFKKAPYWLLTLLVAMPGGMFLNVLLKYTFVRARPVFDLPIIELGLSSYSFPSGHTAAATVFYGALGAYLWCLTRKWSLRALIGVGVVVMVVLVGFSRIYLGAHYLSDVLAAMAESAGWLALCITTVSTLRRRRAARMDQ